MSLGTTLQMFQSRVNYNIRRQSGQSKHWLWLGVEAQHDITHTETSPYCFFLLEGFVLATTKNRPLHFREQAGHEPHRACGRVTLRSVCLRFLISSLAQSQFDPYCFPFLVAPKGNRLAFLGLNWATENPPGLPMVNGITASCCQLVSQETTRSVSTSGARCSEPV